MRHVRVCAQAISALLLAPIASAVGQGVPAPGLPAATIQTAAIAGIVSQLLRVRANSPTVPESVAVQERFDLGKTALDAIPPIIANVNQVLGVAVTEQSLATAANPWSDDNFRNAYDKLDNWTTSLGLIASAAGAFAPAKNRASYMGAGLGLVGIVKALSTIAGHQAGGQFESAAGKVEYTRRAYDDLRARYKTTSEYISANETLIADLTAFRKHYDSAATANSEKQALAASTAFINRLDLVMTQIPAMLQLYQQTIAQYCPDALTAQQSQLGSVVCKTHPLGQANAIVLKGSTRDALLSAAIQLKNLEANRQEADKVRTLAPTLRGALTGQ